MRKIFSLLAIIVLLVSILSSCKPENKTTSNNDAVVVNNCYETGLPIAKDTITLTVMIKEYSGLSNYSNMAINQFLLDELNVKIDWITVPSGLEVNNRVTLAYSSGNLPDIFMGMAPLGYPFHWTYIKDGLIQSLDEYIDKYATNIKSLFEAKPEAKYQATAEDGKIYMIPMVNDERAPFNYEKLYINKTWLSNLGLPMPKTTEEFKNALKSFKTNDPNGNGIADEIPFCLANGDITPGLYGPFGASTYWEFKDITDDGQVRYIPTTNNYKDALTYYRDLFKEGLIDEDWFLQQTMHVKEKANADIVTVGAFVAEQGTNIVSAERLKKDYALVPPLKHGDYQATWTNSYTENIWAEYFMVTKQCKYPEIAVRFADYFYSTEGTLTALNGPPGEKNVWNYDDSKKPVILYDNIPADSSLSQFSATLTPGYAMPHYASKAYLDLFTRPDDQMTDAEKVNANDKSEAIKLYQSVAPKNTYMKFNSTQAENEELEEFSKELADYVLRMRLGFLDGEANLEQQWDAYVENCESIGSKRLIEIEQGMYERYKAFLAKN